MNIPKKLGQLDYDRYPNDRDHICINRDKINEILSYLQAKEEDSKGEKPVGCICPDWKYSILATCPVHGIDAPIPPQQEECPRCGKKMEGMYCCDLSQEEALDILKDIDPEEYKGECSKCGCEYPIHKGDCPELYPPEHGDSSGKCLKCWKPVRSGSIKEVCVCSERKGDKWIDPLESKGEEKCESCKYLCKYLGSNCAFHQEDNPPEHGESMGEPNFISHLPPHSEVVVTNTSDKEQYVEMWDKIYSQRTLSKPQLREEPPKEDEWVVKVKKIVTDWVWRMDRLGELRDFTTRKSGYWDFECPELEDYIRDNFVSKEKIKKVLLESTYIKMYARKKILKSLGIGD